MQEPGRLWSKIETTDPQFWRTISLVPHSYPANLSRLHSFMYTWRLSNKLWLFLHLSYSHQSYYSIVRLDRVWVLLAHLIVWGCLWEGHLHIMGAGRFGGCTCGLFIKTSRKISDYVLLRGITQNLLLEKLSQTNIKICHRCPICWVLTTVSTRIKLQHC